jgi:hypothetical protein
MSVAFGAGAGGRPLLASAGWDCTVRLWDPVTGAAVVTLLRRTAPNSVVTQGTQMAFHDEEGMYIIEVTNSPG